MNAVVSLSFDDQIALICVDNPPVNALSQAVRQGLIEAVERAENSADCRAVVIYCAGKTFIAGADISEFGRPPLEPHLPDVLNRIEACSKPVVIALHGTALGGGFETALAGHYRIALRGSKVGLPEVNLGLIPGAGGTQRLPRAAGLETAIDMVTSGKPKAVEALVAGGVIDRLLDSDLQAGAVAYARELVVQGATVRPLRDKTLASDESSAALFDAAKAGLARSARGQEAPLAALEAIRAAMNGSFDEGLALERKLFLERRASPQSRAMRHAFFAERAVNKIDVDPSVEPRNVNRVGVIGAGTMGSGIAMCFASAGIEVVLLELNQDNLARGLNTIAERYQQAVDRGRLSADGRSANIARITGSCDYQSFSDVDLVVEAAFESMAVKKEIFATLDKVCKPGAILASNTSYLDIDEIAAATSRPKDVLGMHFFSPAHVMKLLEVVRASETSDQVLLAAMQVGKKIGKISVAVGVCYGFVGNRMYSCYGREANALLLEGATPSQIDNAMQRWGMAMGPLSVADLSGIDIGYNARRENPNRPSDPLFFLPADSLVEADRLGQKNGKGFYDYPDGKKTDSEAALVIIRAAAEKQGVAQRAIGDEEIQQRLIFALVNEGYRILDEGIAQRAGDIDTIWLNGYGFPRWRGGPMCYAEELGLPAVLAAIQKIAEETGSELWQPSSLLIEAAQGGALKK